MELNDLKSQWDNAGRPATTEPLTVTVQDQQVQKKHSLQMKKVIYPELIGVFVCCMSAVFVGLYFNQLDTSLLKGAGILAIVLLLAIACTSLFSLRSLHQKNNVQQPYVATIKTFATRQLQFLKLQRINITLCYILLVITIVLLSKFLRDEDITGNRSFWIFSFAFGYLFLQAYSRWVMKYYKHTLQQAKEILQALQDQ